MSASPHIPVMLAEVLNLLALTGAEHVAEGNSAMGLPHRWILRSSRRMTDDSSPPPSPRGSSATAAIQLNGQDMTKRVGWIAASATPPRGDGGEVLIERAHCHFQSGEGE